LHHRHVAAYLMYPAHWDESNVSFRPKTDTMVEALKGYFDAALWG
jgi:hypothetical protein